MHTHILDTTGLEITTYKMAIWLLALRANACYYLPQICQKL